MHTRIIFAALIALTAALPCSAEPPAKPKLAVLIVFDQMRGDFLWKWQDLFGRDGFRRLQNDGACFPDCLYPVAMPAPGRGHASMRGGCASDGHGIVANGWYDRKEAAPVYCASFPRYERVPPAPKVVEPPPKLEPGEKKESEESE